MTGTATAATVETSIVDRSGTKRHTLFPEAKWRALYPNNQTIFGERRAVTFSGSHPENLWAVLDAPYDRGGYGSVVPLRAGAKGWEEIRDYLKQPDTIGCRLRGRTLGFFTGTNCDDAGLIKPARRLLPLLARAKVKVDYMAVLSDGSGIVLLDDGYARLSPAGGEKKSGAWKKLPDAVVALDDASFVVATEQGVFRVASDDTVAPAVLKDTAAPEAQPIAGATEHRLELVGPEVWVVFAHDDKTKVAARPADTPWRRYLPPRPTQEEIDAKKPEHQLPNAVKHTDTCTTPFVMLASNNSAYYTFRDSVAAFYEKGDLQDALTFVQFSRGETSYFGVQTKTVEQANQAMELAKKVKLSPQLRCLDAVSNIPDPTDPPGGLRVYFVNLAHSTLIWPM
jgi:hypothetical protein